MTAGIDRYKQSGRDKEERRRVIEDVHLAFRPELRDELKDVIGERRVPSPAEALRGLATAPDIHRLLKHRLLIDARRRPRAREDDDLGVPTLEVLASTVPVDDPRREEVLALAAQVLEEVVAAPGDERLRAEHWAEWVGRTDEVFRFTVHEATFLACDDERTAQKRRRPDDKLVDCRLLIAQFWSTRPPDAFRRYVNPENWAACSAFWEKIELLSPKVEQGLGYDAEFEETVVYLGKRLTVPLEVAFRVHPDAGRVWTRFNIAPNRFDKKKTPVDVDTGIVSAESVPGGPAPTLVRATKYLHWNDQAPNLPPDMSKLACDFGAVDAMVEMAELCLESSAATDVMGETTTTAGSTDDAVKRLVEEVLTQCRDGIGATGPHLEKLIGRFTGRSWDARWINDLLAIGRVTVDRYGAIGSSVRRFADSLRDADDREGGS